MPTLLSSVGAARHGAAQPQSPQTSLDVVNGSLDNIGFDLPEEAAIPRSSCSLIARTDGWAIGPDIRTVLSWLAAGAERPARSAFRSPGRSAQPRHETPGRTSFVSPT